MPAAVEVWPHHYGGERTATTEQNRNMKIPKNCKIELCASDDITRRAVVEPYLEIDDDRTARVIATNGKMMAVVPVEVDEHDTPGWINPAALLAARKANRGDTVIGLNSTCAIPGGVTMPRSAFDRTGARFPDYRQVVPSGERHTLKIVLDVSLLWRLAQALGSSGPVTLAVDPLDDRAPILVSHAGPTVGTGGRGILMPLRST